MQLLRSSVLRTMMLYFSVSVLINTSFFPTIQRYMTAECNYIQHADSSLLEVILENLLDIEDADTNLADNEDDVSASVDYLSTRSCIASMSYGHIDSKGLPENYHCPDQPTLKRNTPPPKA